MYNVHSDDIWIKAYSTGSLITSQLKCVVKHYESIIIYLICMKMLK